MSVYQGVTPRVFVSYHHGNDQQSYNAFTALFDSRYDVFTDTSLRESIDSDNVEYVMRRIREDFITGSSVTVVLCGNDTPNRKYVDWETKATLDKQHGLVGIRLPSLRQNNNGNYTVPSRLHDNIQTGYALFKEWPSSVDALARMLDEARQLATSSARIDNSRAMMQRNLS